MEDGAANDEVRGGIRKAVRLDRLRPEIRIREARRESSGEGLHASNRGAIGIDRADVVTLAQEEHEVASRAAARVEHGTSREDPSAQKLIEEVDVDRANERRQVRQA